MHVLSDRAPKIVLVFVLSYYSLLKLIYSMYVKLFVLVIKTIFIQVSKKSEPIACLAI